MRYPILLLSLLLSGLAVAAAPSDRLPELKPVPDGAPGPGCAGGDDRRAVRGGSSNTAPTAGSTMLKVIPKVGKPYYLIDQKGDGQFARQDSLDSGMRRRCG